MIVNEKRGQMKISFGMIFSIILIIAFIALAVYGIIWFLGTKKVATVGIFYEDFQSDVKSLWGGTYGSSTKYYSLPKEIEYVCIQKSGFEEDNLFFFPRDHGLDVPYVNIDHLNENKSITYANKQINPLGQEFEAKGYTEYNSICFENKDGKVGITLTKNYGDKTVTISRA